jgi:CelD/BcsL family acetyltransferase involved in cellulose biosynthesis
MRHDRDTRTASGAGGPTGDARPAIQVHTSLGGLAQEWDDLVDRTGGAPFTRPGWIAAWWDAFGGERGRLAILVLRRGGRLGGVLPLVRRRGVLSSTTNDWMSGYDPPTEDSEAARALADALLSPGPRRVEMRLLPVEHPVRAALCAAAAARGFGLVDGPVERSPYVAIEGDWEAYEAGLDRKLRSEVRRRHRRLEEQGDLAVEVLDGTERLDELLDEGFGLEALAWKAAAGTAIVSDAASLTFYREGARWAARRGILRLAFLRLDGRPLAFDLCLEEARVHYLLKIGYDPAFRKYGPGVILRHAMIARAFSAGLSRYEFLGTDLPFKLEWTNDVWEQPWLRAYAPSPAGRLDRLQFTRLRPLARRALRRP